MATTVGAVPGATGARAVRWAVGVVEVDGWGGEGMRVAGERGLGSKEGAVAMAVTAAMAVTKAPAVKKLLGMAPRSASDVRAWSGASDRYLSISLGRRK